MHIIDNTWVALIIFFLKKSDMKFIILVSNLKEISPSIFSWKKYIYKNYDAILPSKYDSAKKKRLNYAYMLKHGVGRYYIFFLFFFIFTQSLSSNHLIFWGEAWMSGIFFFKLSEKNNLFSKSLKNNIIVFQFFWKKMLSLPLCSTRVTQFF